MTTFTIVEAAPADLAAIAQLFRDYAATLPVDLAPQGFSRELEGLPGAYSPPDGALLMGRGSDAPLGCIALRRLDDEACEVKRLYVAPAARGSGLGRSLVAKVIEQASGAGYRAIKLDTLPSMHAAIALYRSFGFTPIAPYGSHPYPGLICLGKALR